MRLTGSAPRPINRACLPKAWSSPSGSSTTRFPSTAPSNRSGGARPTTASFPVVFRRTLKPPRNRRGDNAQAAETSPRHDAPRQDGRRVGDRTSNRGQRPQEEDRQARKTDQAQEKGVEETTGDPLVARCDRYALIVHSTSCSTFLRLLPL